MSLQYGFVNRAVLLLALEAGIAQTIVSVIGLGADSSTLLARVKGALRDDNPALVESLTPNVFDALIRHLQESGQLDAIVPDNQLPGLLDEDGPEGVFVSWQVETPETIFITWSAPPAGYLSEIYVDGVFMKRSTQEGSGTVDDSVVVPGLSAGEHTVRVCYFDPVAGAVTRFGVLAVVEVG